MHWTQADAGWSKSLCRLMSRLSDIAQGIRAADSVDRSVARIHMYQALDAIKIEAGNKKVQEIADEICTR